MGDIETHVSDGLTASLTASPAADILHGADEIAAFLFGDAKHRRKVYHLRSKRLPVFRLGAQLCARRSVLMNWIAEQERRGY